MSSKDQSFEYAQAAGIGSGFFDHLGIKLVQWDMDYALLEVEIGPQHLNRAKVLHGGVLTTLIDLACGLSGCYCAVPCHIRQAVTLSLTTSFTGQASAGIVRVEGRKRAGGRKIYVATAEVTNATGEIIAIGEGSYRYRSGSEEPVGQPA
jgi:uncharacterized protein (TIGR00369 family)